MKRSPEEEVALKVCSDYGAFLEMTHPMLTGIFGASIPQCLLPYPVDIIENALTTCLTLVPEMEEPIRLSHSLLSWYAEDAVAIERLKQMCDVGGHFQTSIEKVSVRAQHERYATLLKNTPTSGQSDKA